MNGEQLLELGNQVDYLDVCAYLEARGWNRSPSRRSYAAIFRTLVEPAGESDVVELQVPLDRDLRDYGEAMVTIARRLGERERRSPEAILRDLLQPRRDLLRFGLEGDSTRDGGVRLVDGLELVSGVRKALLASACTVKRPRPFHPRLGLAEADAFLRECRLGQTEVGSFVLTVETPLTIERRRPMEGEPFGRKTVVTLLQSLGHLTRAVRRGESERILSPGEDEPMVSANLCEALVEMMPSDESADLRVRSSWSPLLPVGVTVESEVHIDRDMYEPIERFAHELRPRRDFEPSQFVGQVVELMGEPGEQGDVEGPVVLQVQVDDELLKVRITLGPRDYRRAANAHLAQRYVSVRGVLHRGPRVHRIDPAEGFEIIGGNGP